MSNRVKLKRRPPIVDIELEKRILTALILSSEVCDKLIPQLDLKYFKSPFIQRGTQWVLDLYKDDGWPPGKAHMQDVYNKHKGEMKEAEAELMAVLLQDLSDAYVLKKDFKPERTIKIALEYFDKRKQEILRDKLTDKLGDKEGFDKELDKYLDEKHKKKIASVAKTEPLDTAFPEWVMDGAAKRYVDTYSGCIEVPKPFLYFSYLTCLGSILSKHVKLESVLEPQPRLYTLLLGESADDRKSTAIKIASKFFKNALGKEMIQGNIPLYRHCDGVASAEGLLRVLDTKQHMLLAIDEFKYFASKCMSIRSALLPAVTTLFENNVYEGAVKDKDRRLEDAHLSILAASTVETYGHVWKEQFTAIGFNNRLWLVNAAGKKQFPVPKEVPPNKYLKLKNDLWHLLEFAGVLNEDRNWLQEANHKLPITDTAYKIYEAWYFSIGGSVHSKRLDTYAMRLMVLLAINELRNQVDRTVMNKVIDLCNWQLNLRKVLDPVGADGLIAGMEEKIRRQLNHKGPLTKPGLKKWTNARRTGIWAFNSALKNLISENEVIFSLKDKKYCLLVEDDSG